jgi:HK97 family phage major capsid protein
MKVTGKLKQLLQSEKGVKPDATEQEFKKAAYAALASDDGFEAKFAATQVDEDAAPASKLLGTLEKLSERLDKIENGGLRSDAPAMPNGMKGMLSGGETVNTDPEKVSVNVKSVKSMFDATRQNLHFPSHTRKGMGPAHPFAGQPVFEGGDKGRRSVQEASQLDMAAAGAFIKFSLTRGGTRQDGIPRKLWMTDLDKSLMSYVLSECEWGGTINAGSDGFGTNQDAIGLGGPYGGQKLTPAMQKAVLDDNTSGGLEAAPIFFDDMLIKIPLLHSEFFPKVNVVNITRGRRIEGASIGTVTITSSTEGTAISLFNTANFIAAFDTTIFVASGAIELGLDFLSDSPIDIAAAVSADYQQVMLQWLDAQVIGGDGTTEPEGILSASGTTTVNATNGSGGPWTVGDIETLLFGVSKAYKGGTDASRIGFGSLETTYRRIRAIAVSTTDQRRVFGMTHEDYRVLDRFWGIGASSVGGFTSNRQAIFANFSRYRMYRRLGLQVTSETAGSTLRRANTMLLIARSRWGGQLEDGAAAAVCADGQS